jgi:hypothetical protein
VQVTKRDADYEEMVAARQRFDQALKSIQYARETKDPLRARHGDQFQGLQVLCDRAGD